MTTSTLPSAVSVTGLRKSFGGKVVLDGIDLDVAEGTIFSLLGPNGAGKTTAVQILSTLLRADAGEVHVAGFDVAHQPEGVRAAIGVTGQFSAVDNLLTGEENLMLMADLHPGANCHHVNSTVPSGRAVEELIRSARWRSSRKKPHSDGRGPPEVRELDSVGASRRRVRPSSAGCLRTPPSDFRQVQPRWLATASFFGGQRPGMWIC